VIDEWPQRNTARQSYNERRPAVAEGYGGQAADANWIHLFASISSLPAIALCDGGSIRGLIPLFLSISSLPAIAMFDIGFIRGLDVPVLALPAPIRGLIQKNSQFFEKAL
jgi:hypothetical protein